MATETETVELSTETTEEEVEASADVQGAIQNLFGDGEQPEAPQKSEAQEEPAAEEETQVQETEPKSETETEQPPAEKAPEEDDTDGLSPDAQLRVNKRIGKEVAKRKELEEKLAAIEGEKAELELKVKKLADEPKETPKATPAANADPLLNVPEIAELHEQEQKAENAFREASGLLRESRKDPDAVLERLKEITKKAFGDIDEAKDWLENVKENAMLKMGQFANKREAASQRHVQKLEQEFNQHREKALKILPALSDKTSKEFKVAQEIKERYPGLLNPLMVPDGPMLMARLVAGTLALEGKGAAPAATKAPPPKLPGPGKTGTSAVTRPAAKPPANALRLKAVESGEVEDIDRALEAIL